MCVNAVSSIKEYLSNETVHWSEIQKKSLDHLLDRCFQKHKSISTLPRNIAPLTWRKLIPVYRNGEPSHTRLVCISTPDYENHRWVIKVETALFRSDKTKSFPTVEEAAYKICKEFRWKTIPKTKVVHEAEKDQQKYANYLRLMEPFKDKIGKFPITCTFQPFIEGNVLPSKEELESGAKVLPLVELSSYQKARLLGMILGYGDDRGDNTVRSLEGRLYQIDPEFIGWENRPSVLDQFEQEKSAPIKPKVMENLLKVTPEQLTRIQAKFMQKDAQLLKHWEEEPAGFYYPRQEERTKETWEIVRNNLRQIQETAQSILKSKGSVTLVELEKNLKNRKEAALKKTRIEREATEKAEKLRLTLERQKADWEKEKLGEPKLSEDMLQDIYKWVQMDYCVVLHNQTRNAYVYYQGKETSIENMRLIYFDLAESTGLLNQYRWPDVFKKVGMRVAPQNIMDQLANRTIEPRDMFAFRFGYRT